MRQEIIGIWHDITNNMRPWCKYSFGVIAFIGVLAAIPLAALILLLCIGVTYVISIPIEYVLKRIKPMFFKR